MSPSIPPPSNLVPFPGPTPGAPERPRDGVIELGIIELDQTTLFKQLHSDFKDDWFPDPRAFSDMIDSGLVARKIQDNFAANHGKYVPRARDVFNIPKPNFTLRYGLETGLCDRVLYHGLTAYLVPLYDALIPWNVFNHRYDHVRASHKSLFKRAVPAWKDFIGTVRSTLEEKAQTGAAFLLSTDISDYFDRIDLSQLRDTVLRLLPQVQANANQKSQLRARIDMLFDCLRYWSYQESRGLPQNRDASSFLANVYMHPVDSALLNNGYAGTYFRYMDDIKIICSSEHRARRALKQLSIALREIGVSLNSKKTVICPAADKRISEYLDEGSADVQHIDEMWRSKSRHAIMRSFPFLKALTLRICQDGRFDSKDFRFCINRLSSLALCPDFGVPDQYFDDLTPPILESLDRCPASTDQLARYLLAAPVQPSDLDRVGSFLCDREKCFYGWQNYHLWSLLARKKHRDVKLIERAVEIIQNEDDGPTRAGASLYIGTLGDPVSKRQLVDRFSSVKTFIGQRCAIIAMHEVPYATIRESVQPQMRDDLVGVYRALQGTRGVYYSPPERIPLTELVDLDSQYD